MAAELYREANGPEVDCIVQDCKRIHLLCAIAAAAAVI